MSFAARYSHAYALCATTGCTKPGTVLCRFPVKNRRTGRTAACNRTICRGCASADKFCPPHARGLQTGAAPALVKICSTCLLASCVHGELRCAAPGPVRLVTAADWKTLLMFPVVETPFTRVWEKRWRK